MTNVVLIYADDLRADLLPWMPFTNGTLRREATHFTACRLNVPVCQAARAGLLTGQYALNNDVYDNGTWGLTDADLFPAWLATAGVDCAAFGKMPVGYGAAAIPTGWSTWRRFTTATDQEKYAPDVFDGTTTTSVGGWATDYLATEVDTFIAGATEPFFVSVTPSAPHVRIDNFFCQPHPDRLSTLSWLRWPFTLEADVSDKPTRISTLDPFDAVQRQQARARIRNQVREARDLDALVESIYASLVSADVLDDTLFVFTADGGVFYGEHRLGRAGGDFYPSAKDEPYDAAAKVPLLVRGPGFNANRTVAVPTTGQDVTALLVDTFAATPTVSIDGISLATIAATPGDHTARHLLYEKDTPSGDRANGIVTQTRKLIHWVDETGDDEWEAYDLDTDPDEHANWANDAGRSAERSALEADLAALLA